MSPPSEVEAESGQRDHGLEMGGGENKQAKATAARPRRATAI
jgi:hypothetical protein